MNTLEIINKVRRQIALALQDDLDGGELIMKEVWEDLDNKDDRKIAKDELRKIIFWLIPKMNEICECEPEHNYACEKCKHELYMELFNRKVPLP